MQKIKRQISVLKTLIGKKLDEKKYLGIDGKVLIKN